MLRSSARQTGSDRLQTTGWLDQSFCKAFSLKFGSQQLTGLGGVYTELREYEDSVYTELTEDEELRMMEALILGFCLVAMPVVAEQTEPRKYLYLDITRGYEIEKRINNTHSIVKFHPGQGPLETVVVEDEKYWHDHGYWYTLSNHTRESNYVDLRINIKRLIKFEERLNQTYSRYKYTDTGESVLVSHYVIRSTKEYQLSLIHI